MIILNLHVGKEGIFLCTLLYGGTKSFKWSGKVHFTQMFDTSSPSLELLLFFRCSLSPRHCILIFLRLS